MNLNQIDNSPHLTDEGSTPRNVEIKETPTQIEVNAKGKDNEIIVQTNLDGSVDVSVDGETLGFSAEEANRLVINAGAGDDNIIMRGEAFGANPTIKINGQNGDDTIHGGDGNYRIYGGRGDDSITVGNGNNYVEGEDGNDQINLGNGNNVIRGGRGDDTVRTGDGNNRIYGGLGNDQITAGNGDNDIEGEDGDDTITVGNGDNRLRGGRGDDVFSIGHGDNDINGGAGRDRIYTRDDVFIPPVNSFPIQPQKEFDLMSFLSSITENVFNNIEFPTADLTGLKGLEDLFNELNVVGTVADLLSDVLQQIGEMLGLPQSLIDLAQAQLHAQLGDLEGAMQELKEALESAGKEAQSPEDMTASDRAHISNEKSKMSDEIISQLMDLLNKLIEDNDKKLGKKIENGESTSADGVEAEGGQGGVQNFFQMMAKILGEILGDKAADMMESLDNLRTSGGKEVNRDDYSDDAAGKDAFQSDLQKQGHEFSVAQAEFSADNQMYSMMQNLVNTVLKTFGESMTTMAKRN